MMTSDVLSDVLRTQIDDCPRAEEDATDAFARSSVLFVGNFLSAAGGNPSVSEDLALHLSGRGWRVLTTSSQMARLPRLWDTVGTIWRRRRAYSAAHVEVYSGLAFGLAEAACWTLRRAGKPYALTLHGGNLPAFAQRRPLRVRRLLQSACLVTAPSQYLVEAMQPYRSDLRLLPNPLDSERYPFRQRERSRPHLVWLRAFSEIYNPSLAPRILAGLIDEFPDARLTMVGPDKGDGSFQRARRVAEACGVADRIQWTGAVPKAEVPQWLNRGDIFLNTTNIDNTPVSVLEAMACGLCVVSTNVGGLPHLLTDGQDALLVAPGDADAMSSAVRRILREPNLARRLSLQSRAKVEQFDWSQVLPQWDRLLTAMLGRCN